MQFFREHSPKKLKSECSEGVFSGQGGEKSRQCQKVEV